MENMLENYKLTIMKELSIEEKAKAYDSIIEKANKMHSENCEACRACIEELIPELAESEDEKIRKGIFKALSKKDARDVLISQGIEVSDALAWLEKQGEKKPNPCDGCVNRKGCVNCENGELREIEQKPEENNGNLGGISPNWSEEEEAVLDALIRRLEGEDTYVSPHLAVECLKSLKDRVQPKQEWSEEDEDYLFLLNSICKDAEEKYRNSPDVLVRKEIANARNWLKSLRPQNRWKPSEDDIIILEKLIKGELEPKIFQATLQGILEQLKKLKDGKV